MARVVGGVGPSVKKTLLDPLFLIGLLIRIALLCTVIPQPVIEWYAPFLDLTTSSPEWDPWAQWLWSGGSPAAFPYGYLMWLVFLPLTIVAKGLHLSPVSAYGATLLAADIGLFHTLRHLLPRRDRLVMAVYWLSPIVILATYGLGYNDLIPALLLTAAVYLTSRMRFFLAGFLCIGAISTKLSVIIALPFFAIYFFNNRSQRQFGLQFLKGCAVATGALILPFLLSKAGVSMLFGNPEMTKVFELSLGIGANAQIFIVPLVYLLMMYVTWRIKRLNFDLFQSLLGIAFLILVLFTPASPGWFVWTLPFLVLYQASGGTIATILCSIFSILYVVNCLLITPQLSSLLSPKGSNFFGEAETALRVLSLSHTAMIAIGILLAWRIWRQSVTLNDFFRLSRKPFVIGIAGDSGAGKDTFSDALKGLFGAHSVATLSGDDYHNWDRHKPMWQVLTHLNPLANDLEGFASALVSLIDGKAIHSRHYDHHSGKMSRPQRIVSNDFIIASGLHSLYLPILRRSYDLTIYLDIDEELRRYFKKRRDINVRGHTLERVLASFDKRESDSAKYIRPQAKYADLTLSLQCLQTHLLDDLLKDHNLKFKLVARSMNSLNELSLRRVLVGVCGLHVDVTSHESDGQVEISMEGDVCAEDIKLAAELVCPHILSFLDASPHWHAGTLGLMQLVTLSHINQALTRRFIA